MLCSGNLYPLTAGPSARTAVLENNKKVLKPGNGIHTRERLRYFYVLLDTHVLVIRVYLYMHREV